MRCWRRSSTASAGVPASVFVRVLTSTKTMVRRLRSVLVVDGDDVELTDVEVDLPADDVVAEALEVAGGEVFTAFAQRFRREPAGTKQDRHVATCAALRVRMFAPINRFDPGASPMPLHFVAKIKLLRGGVL